MYFELPGKLVPFKKLPDVSKWRLRLTPPLVIQKQITFNLSSDVLLLKNGPLRAREPFILGLGSM